MWKIQLGIITLMRCEAALVAAVQRTQEMVNRIWHLLGEDRWEARKGIAQSTQLK